MWVDKITKNKGMHTNTHTHMLVCMLSIAKLLFLQEQDRNMRIDLNKASLIPPIPKTPHSNSKLHAYKCNYYVKTDAHNLQMVFPFKNLFLISYTLLSYVVVFRNVTEKD